MSATRLFIVSGIPPGEWGTGRLVAHLQNEARRRKLSCAIVAKPDPPLALRPLVRQRQLTEATRFAFAYSRQYIHFRLGLAQMRRQPDMPSLILHPQTLGFARTLELIEERKVPPAIFLLDSSYFCVASYNYLSDENRACLRCLAGHEDEARKLGCAPFPKPDSAAYAYIGRLRALVSAGKARLIAQNERQAELAVRHFDLPASPPVCGLWTADWDELLTSVRPVCSASAPQYDVVFHGFDIEAKGARWAERLARHLPSRRFALPFPKPSRSTPPNCDYLPITWESGLDSLLRSSSFALVPSLWSAPVEGALIKSIAVAPSTAVVQNRSAYADELPDDLVLKLPAEPEQAAARLEEALRDGWQAAPEAKTAWFCELAAQRQRFLDRLLGAVPGLA